MNLEMIEVLWKKTEVKDGHWLYDGRVSQDGYGYLFYNRSNWVVSRLSLCIYLGLKYRDNWLACHIDGACIYKNCWNPLHLYQGSQLDNTSDRYKHHIPTKFCKNGHPYTAENTYTNLKGYRVCKQCMDKSRSKYDAIKRKK